MRRLLPLFCALALWPGLAGSAATPNDALPAATLVVYNKSVPDSVALAKFYAQQRKIPGDHVVGLNCPGDEEISRADFDATIATPLRQIMTERKWWTVRETGNERPTVLNSTIHFVALIKGMPMKIKATIEPYPGDEPGPAPIANHNEASVDSELSVLAFVYRHISGAIPNPYFQSYRAIADFENSNLLLVCRLDAPSAATVKRMITDAIATEKTGLWGRAYIDASHNAAPGFEVGDKWLADAASQLHKVGVPVLFDDHPLVLPPGFPVTDCSLYYGWYNEHVIGPFAAPDFRFVPGAVAVHIHSYSAATIRDANAGWVGPLVTHGAAATMGNVYEPYLQLTSHLDVFNDRLIHGFTFAESAYMSEQALSWMTVMVGDPLYRPFGLWAQIEQPRETGRPNEWKAYHDFAVQNIDKPAPQYRGLARQLAARGKSGGGAILEDLGGMEMHDGNLAAATSYFQQARASYSRRDDILRVVLQESEALIQQGKQKRALDLVQSVLRIIAPDTPAVPLLRKIEQDITAPPPPTPPAKP